MTSSGLLKGRNERRERRNSNRFFRASRCWGCAFLLPAKDALRIVETMDVREASYEKKSLDLFGRDSSFVPLVRDVIAYVVSPCPEKRAAVGYLGPAPLDEMARTIATSRGLSGKNVDYLTCLDSWLRQNAVVDDHVRSVAKAVRAFLDDDDEARVCEDDAIAKIQGRVVVDNGAAEVVSNCARSLLAVGVVEVLGDYPKGATVAVVTIAGATIATGRTNYSAQQLLTIAGSRSSRCQQLLPDHDLEPGVVIPKSHMTLA